MKSLFLLAGLLVFAVFWMISTPIFFASQVCQVVDARLSDVLDDLFDFAGW